MTDPLLLGRSQNVVALHHVAARRACTSIQPRLTFFRAVQRHTIGMNTRFAAWRLPPSPRGPAVLLMVHELLIDPSPQQSLQQNARWGRNWSKSGTSDTCILHSTGVIRQENLILASVGGVVTRELLHCSCTCYRRSSSSASTELQALPALLDHRWTLLSTALPGARNVYTLGLAHSQ